MITQKVSLFEAGQPQTRKVVDIETLVKLKLPPLNRTVLRISELLRDENVSNRKLADAVGLDPILAARLLKLANSSMYSRKKTTSSIELAISAVGIKSLYDIVMLGAMADGFSKQIGTMVSGRMVWEHSIVVGLLSRQLSDLLEMRGTEEAFLCGLLHDIGKILLLKAEPLEYSKICQNMSESEMLAEEERVFGLTHAEIGAYVTNKWQLPEVVCGVIMHHHSPRHATVSTVITHIVNVADHLANLNGYGVRHDEEQEVLCSQSVSFLNLTAAQLVTAWENIEDSLGEVLSTFD